jgi:WD40 repeat protein
MSGSPLNVAGSTSNPVRYKAFMSYSHATDDKLAPALQSALHRFAKRWNQLRAMRVFRDKASLSLTPGLWPSIEKALGDSEYFVLMASPESAASSWVQKEVASWLAARSPETILMVLTDGNLVWDESNREFDHLRTTALSSSLFTAFTDEPFYLDLRWAKKEAHLSLKNPQFHDAVATLAGKLHGKDKDEMIGEDVREFKRTNRIKWSAMVALIILTLSSVVAAYFAIQQTGEARQQKEIAEARQREAEEARTGEANQRKEAEASAVEARRQEGIAQTRQKEAEERRQVALGRQLAANASLLFSQQGQNIERSVLLAVESLRRHPTAEGLQTLSRGLTLLPRRLNRISIPVSGEVRQHVLSPGGHYLATVAMDFHSVTLWNVDKGREVIRFTLKGELANLAFSPDGRRLALIFGPAHAEGREIAILESASGQLISQVAPGGECAAMAWDNPGQQLAVAYYDRKTNVTTVRVLDASGKQGVVQSWSSKPEPGHSGSEVAHIAFSPDGKRLATAGWIGIPRVRDIVGGHEVSRMPHIFPDDSGNAQRLQTPTNVEDVVFSPDGRLVATNYFSMGNASKRGVAIWEAATGRLVTRLAHPGGTCRLLFSPDSKRLVTYAGGKTAYSLATDEAGFGEKQIGERTVKVWDLATGAEIYHLSHDDAVTGVVFSSDGKRLATSSWDYTARLWNSGSGRELARLVEPTGVIATAFKDQSGQLVTIGRDYRAQAWEAPPAQGIRLQHGGPVAVLTFNPDGRWLATGSDDNAARLWDTTTGHEMIKIAHPEGVTHVAFSPNGHFLATGMHHQWYEEQKSTEVGLWDIPSGRKIAGLAHTGIITGMNPRASPGPFSAASRGEWTRRDSTVCRSTLREPGWLQALRMG